MWGSRPSHFMIIPNTKRHPNNTKTDQLPTSEVITDLPRPYHNNRRAPFVTLPVHNPNYKQTLLTLVPLQARIPHILYRPVVVLKAGGTDITRGAYYSTRR